MTGRAEQLARQPSCFFAVVDPTALSAANLTALTLVALRTWAAPWSVNTRYRDGAKMTTRLTAGHGEQARVLAARAGQIGGDMRREPVEDNHPARQQQPRDSRPGHEEQLEECPGRPGGEQDGLGGHEVSQGHALVPLDHERHPACPGQGRDRAVGWGVGGYGEGDLLRGGPAQRRVWR